MLQQEQPELPLWRYHTKVNPNTSEGAARPAPIVYVIKFLHVHGFPLTPRLYSYHFYIVVSGLAQVLIQASYTP